MPRNKWYEEKAAAIYGLIAFKSAMKYSAACFQIAVTFREMLTSKTTFISAGALQRIYWVLIRLPTRSLCTRFRPPINKREGLQRNDYDIIVKYE